VTEADTAGAARMLREEGDGSKAAIASKLAAEIYGLEVLRSDIEDATHNTTRFLVLADKPEVPPADNGPVITTFVFRVQTCQVALYKAMGDTNGVNMTKLESYQLRAASTPCSTPISRGPEARMVAGAEERSSTVRAVELAPTPARSARS
jgi:prephenate dehydratase